MAMGSSIIRTRRHLVNQFPIVFEFSPRRIVRRSTFSRTCLFPSAQFFALNPLGQRSCSPTGPSLGVADGPAEGVSQVPSSLAGVRSGSEPSAFPFSVEVPLTRRTRESLEKPQAGRHPPLGPQLWASVCGTWSHWVRGPLGLT